MPVDATTPPAPTIDLAYEELVPLKELAKSLPKRNGKAPAISTLWRWSTTGVRGVVLQTVLVGGQRYSSPEVFRRFVAAGNQGRVAKPETSRAAEETNRQLDALGW